MALPEAAQRKVEEAKRLSEDYAKSKQPPAPAAAPRMDPPPAAPAPQPAADTAALQADVAKLTDDLRRLNAANRNLQAKYEKETPRLMSENDRLKKELDELQNAAKRKIEAGNIDSLGDDERSLAGPMLPVVAKIAREVAESAIDVRLKPVTERMDQFEKQTEAVYFATLDDGVPGWDAQDGSSINDDPKFSSWLQGIDPKTQRTRFDLIQRAQAARQGHRVVDIVNAFKEGREIGARETAKPPPTPPLSPELEAGKPPPVQAKNGKIWSRAEITQFYREKNSAPHYQSMEGKRKAREIELDIFAAQKEERIVG